jgi:radical SAM protein with 4Fe4S-binding SPASM domain
MPKILMQVSYDGEPLHSMYRDAAEEARKAIKWLDDNGLEFSTKSTVTCEGFKYMYDAYLDIKSFSSTLKKKMNYLPTIDHYNVEPITPEYEEDLKNSLIKIARKELEDKTDMFRWFSNNRAICSAGADMIAIDCDGKVYPCHGCLYEDKAEHLIGHINEEVIMDKISVHRNNIKSILNKGDLMCNSCPVKFCLRCNSAKFIRSEKTDYLLKWFDGKSQPELSRFYNINNKLKEAFEEIGRRAM